MERHDDERPGSQPREGGAAAAAGYLGGSPFFTLAVDLCYPTRNASLAGLHDAIRSIEDKRLDPPDDPEEDGEPWHSCSCPDDRCRC